MTLIDDANYRWKPELYFDWNLKLENIAAGTK